MPQNGSSNRIPARVLATHKERYELICTYGEVSARLKSSSFFKKDEQAVKSGFPTTGDFVMIQYNEAGESLIIEILPRKTCLERLDPSSAGLYSQVIAANFDYAFILTSLNNDINIKRIERYLSVAWQSGAVPVVVLTKADLMPNYQEALRKIEKAVKGVFIFACSAVTGEGFEQAQDFLKPGKTIALLGSSGVGKSSFVNAIAQEEIMKVKEIREQDSKGRHTTTHRQLIMLPNGVMVIDTPGMRTMGMWETQDGLNEVFGEAAKLSNNCRYSNCTHTNEPGCAVREALKKGEITTEHWDNYNKLKREARFQQKKDSSKLKEQKEKYKRPKKSEIVRDGENYEHDYM